MYILVAFLAVGLLCNFAVTQVSDRWHVAARPAPVPSRRLATN
jgi:hypothetical protein